MLVRHPTRADILVSTEGIVFSATTTGCKPRSSDHLRELTQKAVGTVARGRRRPYLRVALGCRRGGKVDVHRLVLETFRGQKSDGLLSRHLDGQPHNNEVDNLVYGTQQQNIADSKTHGTFNPRGVLKRNPSWRSPS
jgi:hypothetical protein